MQNLSLMAFMSVGKDVKEVLHALNDWGMTALEEVSPTRYIGPVWPPAPAVGLKSTVL